MQLPRINCLLLYCNTLNTHRQLSPTDKHAHRTQRIKDLGVNPLQFP